MPGNTRRAHVYQELSFFSPLCASNLGPINQEKHPVSSTHHLLPWNPDAFSSDLGAQWSLWHLANEGWHYCHPTLATCHFPYSSQVTEHDSHLPIPTHPNIMGWDIYWFGQKVCLGFPIPSCRKTQTNFLAKPVNFLSRTWFLQVFKEVLRHKCQWSESLWDINVYHKQNQQVSWFASIHLCIFTWEAMLMKKKEAETRRKVMRLWHLYLVGQSGSGWAVLLQACFMDVTGGQCS